METMYMYKYIRDGKILWSPCLQLTFNRRDEGTEVTEYEYNLDTEEIHRRKIEL